MALLWIKHAIGRVVRAQGTALTEAGAFPFGEGAGARDLAEGIAAFFEKRAPQFGGR